MAAKADGFEFAQRAEKLNELEEKLRAFVEYEGPAFLEVMIDQDADVFPMVGPGQSYSEMITGPFIPSRDERQSGGKSAGQQAATDMF